MGIKASTDITVFHPANIKTTLAKITRYGQEE
jgi:hypothetical protein